jgi:anaerobic magnesium-protoporphyrin IX monomethyl ester cyclase
MITFIELRNLSYTWQTPIEMEMKRSTNERLFRFSHYPEFVKEDEYDGTRYINTGGWIQFLTPHLKDICDVVWYDGSEESSRRLQENPSEIFLISVMTLNFSLARQAIEAIDRSRSKVIVGGVHPTLVPVESFKWLNPDYLVVGEADHTIEQLVEAIKQGKTPDVPGLIYQGKNGEANSTSMDGVLSPVERIRLDWSMHLKYSDGVNKRLPIIIASRDCPYTCNFCSILKTKRFRLLPLQNVIAQIEDLQAQLGGQSLHVMFEDPVFFGNVSYAEQLVEALAGMDMTWDCQNRIEHLTPRKKTLYKKMYKAGCRAVYFGIESCKQHVIDNANKRFNVNDIMGCVRSVREAGILVHAGFVVGFPGQSRQDIEDDLEFAVSAVKEDALTTIEYFFLSIYPGSKFGISPSEFGLELNDFEDYDSVERKVRHSTRQLRHNEIWDIYLEGCKRVTEVHGT